MLRRILTGGQTGADQAAWRAARAAGLPTGGWMPRGFRIEVGPRPEFAALYNAMEHRSDEWAERTVANIAAADATLVFPGDRPGPGTELTIAAARDARRPYLVVPPGDETTVEAVACWIDDHAICVLNVAGDRESVYPGIGMRVEAFLADVFRLLRDREAGGPGHA